MKKLSYILLIMLIVACAPSLPSGILDKEEMEDVLYDMHVAQVMHEREEGVSNDADIFALRKLVLEKHGITQEQWDSTFFYYSRNSQDLYEIYNKLSERVNGNVMALGGKVDGMQGDDADTANVWNMEPTFILMQQAPYNRLSFEVIPDSTFEDGDRLTLQYDVQMLFQDGYRDVTSYLVVHYANDSISTSVTHNNGDGHGVITINNDVERLHVNKIRGFFLLNQNLTQNTSEKNITTLRLASIRNVKLLHLRTIPPAKVEATKEDEPLDSLKRDSLMKDSVMNSHVTIINN